MAPISSVLSRLGIKGCEDESCTQEGRKTLDKIKFTVNDVECTVSKEVSSDDMLVDYIRNYLELRGTKYMCREAGCGACVVCVVFRPGSPPRAVNSCVVPIMMCHGWSITTIEKVGNRKDGYHNLQKLIVKNNATQCGHCTPGMVMSMYSLQQANPDMTMMDIEKSLCSNLCRCTGYRPILDAFKSCASDAKDRIVDIEDMHVCEKTGKTCGTGRCVDKDWCMVEGDNNVDIKLTLKDGKRWYVVSTLDAAFKLMVSEKTSGYKIVHGNTARAVFPFPHYTEAIIDICRISELKGYTIGQNLIVGAGNTITDLMQIFEDICKREYFGYLKKLHEHLVLVGHPSLRNLASIGGNLMIKNEWNEFQSDLFLIFQTVGAQITIKNVANETEVVTMEEFVKLKMANKLIINIIIPPLPEEYKMEFYKIMSRAQAVHAVVNAGFCFKLHGPNHIVKESKICYGALSSTCMRAYKTEHYLIGKPLFTNETLQGALNELDAELEAVDNHPEPSAVCRKALAMKLFYKGLLSLCPSSNTIHPLYKSGATSLYDLRPVSQATHTYETDSSRYPIGQPLSKTEALIQSSGEAVYTEDLPKFPNEVFAEFVLATVGSGDIVSIDPTEALNTEGVIAFYTAQDICGKNSFTPSDAPLFQNDEVVLCDGSVKYKYQPLGIIVAETRQIACRAATLVEVTYKNVKTPVTDILEAKKDSARCSLYLSANATDKGTDIKEVIKGRMTIYGQYHFPMEGLVCVVKPTEKGLDVHCPTQWMSGVSTMISRALAINENCINVHCPPVGGSYGLKISRIIQEAVACSLVATKLNRPCRLIQSLSTTMKAVGKRLPCSSEYEVAVSQTGVIQHANIDLYEDNGYMVNENFIGLAYDTINNCYPSSKISYKCYNVITDTAKNTWCRSPGTLEFIANIENMMEHISYVLNLDPWEARLRNIDTTEYGDLVALIDTIKTKADYESRRTEIAAYNKANRWKKRGLGCSALRWTPVCAGLFNALVTVFASDGSVCISHGGIEMGQGINTKVIQVCSKLLDIPMDTIKIEPFNSHVSPNCFVSGGSVTSENVIIAVTEACEILRSRLEPIKESMTDPTWKELIATAHSKNVNLQVQASFDTNNHEPYHVYGVCLTEAEIDVLTGEREILRMDMVLDVGASINPEIDIGQVEGAIIMGIGYWCHEELFYHSDGGLLTNRTWNYHVPGARDIPQVMNVHFKENSYGTTSTYGAKCVGEPPMCMMQSVIFAIREALISAITDSANSTCLSEDELRSQCMKLFEIDGLYSVAKICTLAAPQMEELKFY